MWSVEPTVFGRRPAFARAAQFSKNNGLACHCLLFRLLCLAPEDSTRKTLERQATYPAFLARRDRPPAFFFRRRGTVASVSGLSNPLPPGDYRAFCVDRRTLQLVYRAVKSPTSRWLERPLSPRFRSAAVARRDSAANDPSCQGAVKEPPSSSRCADAPLETFPGRVSAITCSEGQPLPSSTALPAGTRFFPSAVVTRADHTGSTTSEGRDQAIRHGPCS
jgi:hypothetical protein